MGFWDFFFGPPKPDQFADLMLSALRRAGDSRRWRYDQQQFRLTCDGEGPHRGQVAPLQKVYQEYCQSPRKERRRHLERFALITLSLKQDLPEDFDDARPRLRPRVLSRWTLECQQLQARIQGDRRHEGLPFQPLGEHLCLCLAYDLPHAVRFIESDMLDEWNVSFYEAMEVATQNLLESTESFVGIEGHLYMSVTGDSYDSSRLVLQEQLRRFDIEGEYVAMLPNRNTLLITGSEDEVGLRIMLDLAEKAQDEPQHLAPLPLLLEGDQWVDWQLDPEHPLYERFRKLRLTYFHQLYAEQKQLLDTLYGQEQANIFIASYFLAGHQKTGELVNHCVWGDGVDSLLPRTEKIMFHLSEEDPADSTFIETTWDYAQALCGHLLEEIPELYPPRYRVVQFPSKAQLMTLAEKTWQLHD